MANEFKNLKDTNIVQDQISKSTNEKAVDVVNNRLRSAMGTLKDLGFSPTTEESGLQAVIQLATMYERQAEES